MLRHDLGFSNVSFLRSPTLSSLPDLPAPVTAPQCPSAGDNHDMHLLGVRKHQQKHINIYYFNKELFALSSIYPARGGIRRENDEDKVLESGFFRPCIYYVKPESGFSSLSSSSSYLQPLNVGFTK